MDPKTYKLSLDYYIATWTHFSLKSLESYLDPNLKVIRETTEKYENLRNNSSEIEHYDSASDFLEKCQNYFNSINPNSIRILKFEIEPSDQDGYDATIKYVISLQMNNSTKSYIAHSLEYLKLDKTRRLIMEIKTISQFS